jgi:hypothetical protein
MSSIHPMFPIAALSAILAIVPGVVAATEDEEETTEEVVIPADPLFEPGAPAVEFQEVPRFLPSLSAQSCDACHGDVVEQWRESGHGQAWLSPLYQKALDAAEEPAYCLRCHAPLLNQRASTVTGYDEGQLSRPHLQDNERFDPTLRNEGVTCAACHVRDGRVLGPRTLVRGQGPHPVDHHPELADSSMCASCHQLAWPGTEESPLYDTYREWQGSAWGAAGVRCQDCHMPLEMGRVSATRFVAHPSHRCVGASDDAQLARALTVLVGPVPPRLQRGDELAVQVRVINTGAGHHVPTGNPHSWIEATIHVEGVEGLAPQAVSWSLQREVSLEADHEIGEDTRLAAGAERVLEYAITPDKKLPAPADLVLVVELIYHQLPADLAAQYELEDARVFHRQEIEIPLR